MEYNNKDKFNWLLAGLTTLVAFIVYFKTMAVSVSLWDCGEFIACSRIMGIAHPPGTPLFIIIGRIFSFLPFLGQDIAHRITFVSVIFSALSIGISYLAVSKIISFWIREKKSFIDRLPMYIGGIVGALTMAFSRTWWTNAVEAEVYGLTLLASVVAVYMALLWFEKRDDPQSDKYLFVMIFVAMLGVAAHLAAFMVMPALFLFIFISSPRLLKEPRVWVSVICAMLLMMAYDYFIWATFAWLLVCIAGSYSEKEFDWLWLGVFIAFVILGIILRDHARSVFPWFVGLGMAAFIGRAFSGLIRNTAKTWLSAFALFMAVSVVLMLVSENLFVIFNLILLPIFIVKAYRSASHYWRWALSFGVLMALAFSVQYTVLVRAQHRPRINMTNPTTLSRMDDYLARKQYGQGNMITRMFHRRGHLANQFGDYPRMGMLGFWKDQYSKESFPFVIWLFVGLWGLYYASKMRRKSGILIFLLILAGTVGITLYMNFADGSQAMIDENAKLEVRDRDYFWTHGFAMFGWAIGLGIAGFMHALNTYLRSKEGLNKLIIPVSVIFSFSIFLPVLGISQNYYYNNRSGEWLPYQFAYDMLEACGPNAVLFTAGDNDTYPLWALQEAYSFRRDVKIINLSLANVDWYVLHTKEVFGAPMAVDHDQIEVLDIKTPSGIERRPERMYDDYFINRRTYFGTRPVRDSLGRMTGLMEMAQLTIEKVIEASLEVHGPSGNKFFPVTGDTMIMKFPVYFTSLTGPVINMRFREQYRYLERVTDLYKVRDTIIVGVTPLPRGMEPFAFNIDESYRLLDSVFTFNGLGDPKNARGEFTTMMVHRYYANEYDIVIDSMLARNDTLKSLSLIEKAIINTPENQNWPWWKAVRDSLRGGSMEKLPEYEKEYIDYMNTLLRYHSDNYYYRQFLSEMLFNKGKVSDSSESYYEQGLKILEDGFAESPQSQWLFEGIVKGYVALNREETLQSLISNYQQSHPDDFYAPVYLITADYISEKDYKSLDRLLRAFFTAAGMQPAIFEELVRFSLARRDTEAFYTIQRLYMEIHPNDTRANAFINSLFSPPPGQGN